MSDKSAPHQSSLKVSIRPLQASFFAGEDVICQITFTNTNPKLVHTQPLPQGEFANGADVRPSFDQKSTRSVVSSIPTHSKSRSVDVRALGRSQDPSSSKEGNRLLRSKSVLRQLNREVLPDRRNLIGKSAASPSAAQLIHPWSVGPSRPSHRSTQSTSVTPPRNRSDLGLGRPSPAPNQSLAKQPQLRSDSHRFSPPPPTRKTSLPGLAMRTPSAPISNNHSHSRKKSVAQVQAEHLTEAFELDSGLPSVPPSPATTTPTSWLSAGPDDSTAASSFYGMGRNDTMESVFRESVTDWSQSKRRPSIARSPTSHSPIYPPPDTLAPGSENILWSFAQLGGTIEIDESLIKPSDFENLKRRLAYGDLTGANASAHSLPGTPRTLGGGDFGQTEDAQAARQSRLSGLLRAPFASRAQAHRRTGSTMQDAQHRTLQSRSVPTFSAPPSIVAVDLVLGAGESKTYEFKMRLPVDLPPSYQGKAIKLRYVLTLGTNRADAYASSTRAQSSRLIQIPIRVYNHVGASGFRPFFDLMNPVILTREEATVTIVGQDDDQNKAVTSGKSTKSKPASKATARMQREELQEYARQLLASSAASCDGSTSPLPEFGLPSLASSSSVSNCKSSVEVLARTSTKVSYDISKDGKVAAVLTLMRSRFRLGDTLTGVIDINQAHSVVRIARFSATLETFEEIQPSIATMPPGRLQRATRVVHAQHHESVLDKGRAHFSLVIPSGATPDFVTSGVKLNWLVKLAFLTVSATNPNSTATTAKLPHQAAAPPSKAGLPLPPPHLLPSTGDGFARYYINVRALDSLAGRAAAAAADPAATANVLKQLGRARETKLETVECAVPISVLPNSTSFKVGDAEFFA